MMITDDPRGLTAQYRDTQAEINWAQSALNITGTLSWDNNSSAETDRSTRLSCERIIRDRIHDLNNPDILLMDGEVNWEMLTNTHLLSLAPTINNLSPTNSSYLNSSSPSDTEYEPIITPSLPLNVTGLHDTTLSSKLINIQSETHIPLQRPRATSKKRRPIPIASSTQAKRHCPTPTTKARFLIPDSILDV